MSNDIGVGDAIRFHEIHRTPKDHVGLQRVPYDNIEPIILWDALGFHRIHDIISKWFGKRDAIRFHSNPKDSKGVHRTTKDSM